MVNADNGDRLLNRACHTAELDIFMTDTSSGEGADLGHRMTDHIVTA